MTIHRDLRGPLRTAESRGWCLTRGRKHWKLRKGADMVVISVSLSDHRAVKNVMSDLKRKGAI